MAALSQAERFFRFRVRLDLQVAEHDLSRTAAISGAEAGLLQSTQSIFDEFNECLSARLRGVLCILVNVPFLDSDTKIEAGIRDDTLLSS